MARFFHVVGPQGIGKSQLIRAMVRDIQSGVPGRVLVCAGQDPDIFTSREEAVRERPGADAYFIEYQSADKVRALPGELVITMSVGREPSRDAG